MKYADRCSYVGSEKSARRLLKIANPFEPGQGGRIQIEKINEPLLFQLKGTPAEYKAGLDLAIAKDCLVMHESGTLVKFTQARADLFA